MAFNINYLRESIASYNKLLEAKASEDDESFQSFKQELLSSGNIKSQFDEIFYSNIYPGSGYKTYISENEDDLFQVIEDAKEGNEFATYYLLDNAKQMIYYVFWKNFIGAKASGKIIKRRLDNGDFNEFISLIFIAFSKAIESFKPKVYKNGGVKIGNWQYWLGQYLKAEAISYNKERMNDPLNDAIQPDTMDPSEKGGATAWDKITGGKVRSTADDSFLDSWAELCDDPELDELCSRKVEMTKRELVAEILAQERSIPEIAAEIGVTKNTLYTAANIGGLLRKYDISQEDLAQRLHDDPDMLIQMLRK